MSALEEYLAGDDLDDEERERWRVDGPGTAEWALRRLARAKRLIAEAEELAESERARIDMWLANERKRQERDVAFFEGALREFHASVLAEDPKRKTLEFPMGVLKARKVSDSVRVVDEAAFRDFAEGNGRVELLNIKVTPKLLAIREAVLKDGEPIPGVEPVRGEGFTFSVEVAS